MERHLLSNSPEKTASRFLVTLLSGILSIGLLELSIPALADWEVEPTHTHIGFEVGHLGLTKTPGIFRSFESTVKFDEDNIASSSIVLSIDAASIDTVSDLRDTELRNTPWFDVRNFPKITFTSTSVKHGWGNRYCVKGDLTIRDKTVPVSFRMKLTNRTVNPWMKIPAIGFVGSTKIKRSDFGMTSYLGAIDDEVELHIALELLKKP